MELTEHNERVRALAARMPPGPLSRAVCAIGYRADKHTGITSGYSVATMAKESRKPQNLNGAYGISRATLRRAIEALAEAVVIEIRATVRGPDDGWKQANTYLLDYSYTDTGRVSEVWMGRRQRRRQRARKATGGNPAPAKQETERLAALADYPEPPADEEAERMAALADYPEPAESPGSDCAVCEGTHDRSHGGDVQARWKCETCKAHASGGHDG
jgi:hypothetical protein